MIGVICITHGNLGRELLNAAELISGKHEKVEILGLQASDAIDALPGRIAEAVQRLGDEDGILVLVDLFGGSPCNASLRYLAEHDLECVSGVNLPMLLEVLTLREGMSVRELALQAIEVGRDGVRDVGGAMRQELGR